MKTLLLVPALAAGLAFTPTLVESSPDEPRWTSGRQAVQPGQVRWHADFDAARAAARESGKPVLLFQLLGRLDEEHC